MTASPRASIKPVGWAGLPGLPNITNQQRLIRNFSSGVVFVIGVMFWISRSRYVMGPSDHERGRLVLHASILHGFTEHLFRRAGINRYACSGCRLCGVQWCRSSGAPDAEQARLRRSTSDPAALQLLLTARPRQVFAVTLASKRTYTRSSRGAALTQWPACVIIIHTKGPIGCARRAPDY